MSRPLSEIWQNSASASLTLGIEKRQLRRLRRSLKPGIHYRILNPESTRPSYLWNVRTIADYLVPKRIDKPKL
jgi:hypothetical protein